MKIFNLVVTILIAVAVVVVATNQNQSPASCVLGMYQSAKIAKVAKVSYDMNLSSKDTAALILIEFLLLREMRFVYKKIRKLHKSELINEIRPFKRSSGRENRLRGSG